MHNYLNKVTTSGKITFKSCGCDLFIILFFGISPYITNNSKSVPSVYNKLFHLMKKETSSVPLSIRSEDLFFFFLKFLQKIFLFALILLTE